MRRIPDGDDRLLRAVQELVAMLRLVGGVLCITLHDGKATKLRVVAESSFDNSVEGPGESNEAATTWQSPVPDNVLAGFVRERLQNLIRERIGDHGHLDVTVKDGALKFVEFCIKWKLAG